MGYLAIRLTSPRPALAASDYPPPGTLCQDYEFENEPHPLRPAPGLPCEKQVPKIWNLSCANDALPTLNLDLPRTTAQAQCSPTGDFGRLHCRRQVKEWQAPPVELTIDLTKLELPVAGVASNTQVSDSLSDSQKMRNYTSWFLQGTLDQSDQEPPLSFSGPIKKLIPKSILDDKRRRLVLTAAGRKTYNQIIGYVKDNKVIGRNQAKQLLAEDPRRTDVAIFRLADMKDHLSPAWDPDSQEAIKWYTLWQQVPFAAEGLVDVPGEVFPTACVRSQEDGRRCASDPSVLDAQFTVTSGLDSFRVNFPHLLETNSILLSLLQSAFIDASVPKTNPDRPEFTKLEANLNNPNRQPDWTVSDDKSYRNDSGCVQNTAGWNPGDNLEAAQNQNKGQIRGVFNFKKDIAYEFDIDTPASLAFIRRCQLTGEPGCPTPLDATVPVGVSAPVPVFIRYSHMDDIADRAIAGPGAIFKALFPNFKDTENALTKPAEADIRYSCSVAGSKCRAESTNQRQQAKAFFPRWGGILELFHQKLQQMLDPLTAALGSIGGRLGSPGAVIGQFQLTYYLLTKENDFPGPANTQLFDRSCKVLATVPGGFAADLTEEGSGKLKDGRVLQYAGSCNCGFSPCFTFLGPEFPWGQAATSGPLVPFRTIAVDPSVIPLGKHLYIKEFDGIKMPGDPPWGGFVHDGCVVAEDTGSAIVGNHIDFFSALDDYYRILDSQLSANVAIQEGGSRCR